MKTKGHFRITPCLQEHHAQYLHAFASIRHVYWKENIISTFTDPLREAVGLPRGEGGLYVVGIPKLRGQQYVEMMKQTKISPLVPGFYCPWIPTEDRCGLMWDGGETDDDWCEWVAFLREHFLDRWGYTISGEVWMRDVFQGQFIEGKVIVGDAIEFVVLKEYPKPNVTDFVKKKTTEFMMRKQREQQID